MSQYPIAFIASGGALALSTHVEVKNTCPRCRRSAGRDGRFVRPRIP